MTDIKDWPCGCAAAGRVVTVCDAHRERDEWKAKREAAEHARESEAAALRSEVKRLREDAEYWHVQSNLEGKSKLSNRAELRAQENATQQLSAEVLRISEQLAAAHALLAEAVAARSWNTDWVRRARDYLASNPAEQAKADPGIHVPVRIDQAWLTVAEQRVLDAMRVAAIAVYRDGRRKFLLENQEQEVCEAELARRAGK